MAVAAPLDLHRARVRPEWIDYNGHMNVAYYVLAFDHAVDTAYGYLGLDEGYRHRTGGTTFAVESHVTYQRELKSGDPIRCTTQILGFDAKRLHHFHRMYHADEGYLAATCEWLNLHVDLVRRRVVPWPAPVLASITRFTEAQPKSPLPDEICGRIHVGQALFRAEH